MPRQDETGTPTSLQHGDEAAVDNEKLQKRSWANWLLLAGALGITTIAFVLIAPASVGDRLSGIWPWANTEVALVVSYIVVIFTFIGYLTYQQRLIARMNANLLSLRQEAKDYKEKQSDRLYALFDVSRVMGVESDPQTVLDRITAACVGTFRSDQSSLMIYDEKSGRLQVRSAHGHTNPARVLGSTQTMGEGIAGWAAMERKALILGGRHGMEHPDKIQLNSKFLSSAMVVPIILRDELVGVLNLSSRSSDVEYDHDDLRALEVFAANAGACIRHAERSEWMRQTIRQLQRKLETDAGSGQPVSNSKEATSE